MTTLSTQPTRTRPLQARPPNAPSRTQASTRTEHHRIADGPEAQRSTFDFGERTVFAERTPSGGLSLLEMRSQQSRTGDIGGPTAINRLADLPAGTYSVEMAPLRGTSESATAIIEKSKTGSITARFPDGYEQAHSQPVEIGEDGRGKLQEIRPGGASNVRYVRTSQFKVSIQRGELSVEGNWSQAGETYGHPNSYTRLRSWHATSIFGAAFRGSVDV